MTLEIQVLAWYRHKNVVGLNQLMRSQPSLKLYFVVLPKSSNCSLAIDISIKHYYQYRQNKLAKKYILI